MKSFNQDKENVLLIFKVEEINIACHPINYSCSLFLMKQSRMSEIHISSSWSIDLKGKLLSWSSRRPSNKTTRTGENQRYVAFYRITHDDLPEIDKKKKSVNYYSSSQAEFSKPDPYWLKIMWAFSLVYESSGSNPHLVKSVSQNQPRNPTRA